MSLFLNKNCFFSVWYEKNKILLKSLLLVCSLSFLFIHASYSQSKNWSINIGNSITRYDFINSKGVKNDYLKPGSGNAYSIGYSSSLLDTNRISNKSSSKSIYFLNHAKLSKILSSTEFGLNAVMNQFNAVGNIQNLSFDYQTNFVGLEGHLGPNFNIGKNWKIHTQVQTSLQYLIQGNQYVNFDYVDLRKDSDFNSIKLLVGYSGTLEKKVYKFITIFITYANNQTINQSQLGLSSFNFNYCKI